MSTKSRWSASRRSSSSESASVFVGPYEVEKSSQTSSAEGAISIESRETNSRSNVSPSSAVTWSSRPQPNGDPAPGGGGGAYAAMTRNMSPRVPSGRQQARPTRPSGRVTRASSAAMAAWSGANMTPQADDTTSKDASSYGSASASPTS